MDAATADPTGWVAYDGEALSAHIEGGPQRYEPGPSGIPLAAALEWALARASRVLVRPTDHVPYFNAGAVDVDGYARFETYDPANYPRYKRVVMGTSEAEGTTAGEGWIRSRATYYGYVPDE